MTDNVTFLRSLADEEIDGPMFVDCADEIERLTAALDAETERCASILEAKLHGSYDVVIGAMLAAIRGEKT